MAKKASTDKNSSSQAVEQFASATEEVLSKNYPTTERATLWLLAIFLVGLFVFISVAKIDRIVTAQGRLVPVGGTITVQPLETQVINRILVSVGDVVKKDQILAQCDPTLSEATRARLEDQATTLDALTRRLSAEETGAPFVPDFSKPYDELQNRLYLQRKTELTSSVSDFEQRMRAIEEQNEGLKKTIADLDSRRKIGNEMEGMHDRLSKEGYVSQLQLLNIRDQQLSLQSQLSSARSSLTANQHQLSALRDQKRVFLDRWRSNVVSELVAARSNLEGARQELTKAARLRDLVNLTSPMDAVVTRIPQLSAGGVAGGSQPLFGLVPLNAQLQAAIKIESKDIGYLKVGSPVNLKFDSYKFMEHGIGKGVITTFSQDSFSEAPNGSALGSGTGDSRSNSALYDARVRITDLELRDVPGGKARLIPGMTLQADIIVGSRTILWYFLGGVLHSSAEAMQEP
jgi:hemolysin D